MKQEGYIKDLFHRGGSSTSSLPPEPLYCVVFNFTTGFKNHSLSERAAIVVNDFITQPYPGLDGKYDDEDQEMLAKNERATKRAAQGLTAAHQSVFKQSGLSSDSFRTHTTDALYNKLMAGLVCDLNMREDNIVSFVTDEQTFNQVMAEFPEHKFMAAIGSESVKLSQYAQSLAEEYQDQLEQGAAIEVRHLDA